MKKIEMTGCETKMIKKSDWIGSSTLLGVFETKNLLLELWKRDFIQLIPSGVNALNELYCILSAFTSMVFHMLTLKRSLTLKGMSDQDIARYHLRQNPQVWIIFSISDLQKRNFTKYFFISFPPANIVLVAFFICWDNIQNPQY